MKLLRVASLICLTCPSIFGAEFQSAWPTVERTWIGPEYWANRLQDWRLAGGRLECVTAGPDRNVNLLTHRLSPAPGELTASVRLSLSSGQPAPGYAGLRLGTKGRLYDLPDLTDWRDDAMRGTGLDVGVTGRGVLFIGQPGQVAEIGLPREGWSIRQVSSQHNDETSAAKVLDGNPATIWHGKFGAEGGAYPHWLVLDLGAEQRVRGLGYLPRQEQTVGRIKGYQLHLSVDGLNWGEPVAAGEFAEGNQLHRVTCPETTARYVRLTALSSHDGRPACAIAELYVLGPGAAPAEPAAAIDLTRVELRVHVAPEGERYRVTVSGTAGEAALAPATQLVEPRAVEGGLALVVHKPGAQNDASVRWSFADWRLAGSKLTAHPERRFGPILWSQYTLSRGVLTITAQLPPLGERDSRQVRLEIDEGGAWREIGRTEIDPDARTATIRRTDWDGTRDVPYRLVYTLTEATGPRDHTWRGVFRKDPVAKDPVVIAAFTGNSDPAFPNVELVRHVAAHDPDLLFFSGDQIYEPVNGYGIQRSPLDEAILDYLRKWYVYGWAFGELMRDRPTISIPDDHDVYQGNLWGAGGRATDKIERGGYLMPARWVNAVERTQTSNLPPPFDPTPIEQGIGVYYTEVNVGRVSCAVLEDRKFKSGPEGLVRPTGSGRPDWIDDPTYDMATVDLPEAELLGQRQLKFLDAWAADWRGTDFKVALSQTVFANAATHHGPNLRYLRADFDSNGWPQTGRRRALEAIRRGCGFMIGGDQHLATIIHHGLDDWEDAGWSFLVPSVTNYYLRAWTPPTPPLAPLPGRPDYCGRFLDGFGNKITLWAATNPTGDVGHQPEWLHNKKPGYGIVRFAKAERTITMECWPRYADPRDPRSGGQYDGWPKTIRQEDNDGRRPVAWLPRLEVRGLAWPVVQVLAEADGQIVYTRRLTRPTDRLPVFAPGRYTLRVGEPDTGTWKTLGGLAAGPADSPERLLVEF